MTSANYEHAMSKVLAIGVPSVTLFLVTSSVTDPVNITKFLVLGGVGFAALALWVMRGFRHSFRDTRSTVLASAAFILFSAVSVIFSNLPLSQNLYGVYGRNTGFLTYLFLVGVLLGALSLRESQSFRWLYFGLFFAGLINVIYCGWVVFFGDFIGWSNPYGNILGFFGNPNFIGAFLGIWISATFGYSLGKPIFTWKGILTALLLMLAAYEVYKSHAVQGVVVTSVGLATVMFFFIRSRTTNWVPVAVYSSALVGFGITALLGALQKGPLAQYIYKTSVSLRGAYWHAAIEMGLKHPLTGVGMDGYGDWYRRARSVHAATVLPGPKTVSNSAHNVPLDIFSYGGFPLLFSYLALILLGATAIVRGLRRTKAYDPVFVALTVAWIGYQLQSIISINQIGLAVWGWVLTGALIAYERSMNQAKPPEVTEKVGTAKKDLKVRTKSEVISGALIAGLACLVGLILACPPISSDMAWVKATRSGSLAEVQNALRSSYLRPQNPTRYVNAVAILEQNQLFDQAHTYAKNATKLFPENFEAWFSLCVATQSSPSEKAIALENLHRLDPKNLELNSCK
jgi:O-antigen ligase